MKAPGLPADQQFFADLFSGLVLNPQLLGRVWFASQPASLPVGSLCIDFPRLDIVLRGEYGRLPAPVNEEVRKKAIGDEEVITGRPADLIAPELDKYREEIREYYTCEEDVLSYALFPQVALKFFQYRQARDQGIDSTLLKDKTHPV